eukprot:Em0016g286a
MWNRLGLLIIRRSSSAAKVSTVHQALQRADGTFEAEDGLSRLKNAINAAKSAGTLATLPHTSQYQSFSDSLINGLSTAPPEVAVEYLQCCANHNFTNDKRLIKAAITRCVASPQELSERSLSSALLACATLRNVPRMTEASSALAAEVSRRLSNGENLHPIAVTNMAWALVSLNAWSDSLTPVLIDYLKKQLDTFPFHSIALLLWSLAKAGVTDKDVFSRASQLCCSKGASNYDQRSFLQIAWALATVGHYNQPFFDMLSDKLLAAKGRGFYTPRTLSSISWSLAKAQHYRPDVLDHIADHSLVRLHEFNSHDLGNLAYAFGSLNQPRKDLLVAVAERFFSDPQLRANNLAHANIVWSCIVSDVYPEQLVKHSLSVEALQQVSDRQHPQSPNMHMSKTSMQVLQLHVALTREHPELGLGGLPPEQTRDLLTKSYEAVMSYQQTSVFQRNVWRALEGLGGGRQYYLPEALTRSGYIVDAELLLAPDNKPVLIPRHWYFRTIGYVRDVLLGRRESGVQSEQQLAPTSEERGEEEESTKNLSEILSSMEVTRRRKYINLASDWHGTGHCAHVARRVAVEADGPEHFAMNCNHPLGRTVLKHRQLKAMGWDVISVSPGAKVVCQRSRI